MIWKEWKDYSNILNTSCSRNSMHQEIKLKKLQFFGYNDVDDRCWRQNVLVTSLRCGWPLEHVGELIQQFLERKKGHRSYHQHFQTVAVIKSPTSLEGPVWSFSYAWKLQAAFSAAREHNLDHKQRQQRIHQMILLLLPLNIILNNLFRIYFNILEIIILFY